MQSNEKIMTAIRQRGDLCDPFLTVGKILEVGGMKNWTNSCCSRIADAELIDGEEIRIDFLNIPDLQVTAEGVKKCREILECYVTKDVLVDAHEALCAEESVRYSINEVARILREMKWRDLFNVLAKSDTREKVYVGEEVRQRICLGAGREKVRRLFYNVIVRVKYRHLLDVCKELRG